MKTRREKSKEYWFDREMENTRKNIREEKNFEKYLNGIYLTTLKDIEDDINKFYVKYSTDEGISMAEAKKRVKAIDVKEYESKAKKYVKNKDFTKTANAEMKLYNLGMKINRLELLKTNINLEITKLNSEIEKSIGKKITKRALDEFKRQAGILGKGVANPRRRAEIIASASFHNADFSERIWANATILRNNLDTILQKSFLKGEHPKKMVPKLRKVFRASAYEAQRLAVTEMARVQIEAQKESFINNGFEQYMFHDTDGSKVCEHCRALDGKKFDVKKMVVGENSPPMHPNCRCSISAYEDSETYEKWVDYLESGGTTDSWLKFNAKEDKATFEQDFFRPLRYGQITRYEAGKIYAANKNGYIEVLPETINTIYNETELSLEMAGNRYNNSREFYTRIYDSVHYILKEKYDKAQEILNRWEKDQIELAGKRSKFFKYQGKEAWNHEIKEIEPKPKKEPVKFNTGEVGKLSSLVFEKWFENKLPEEFVKASVDNCEFEVVRTTEKAVQIRFKKDYIQWLPKSAILRKK